MKIKFLDANTKNDFLVEQIKLRKDTHKFDYTEAAVPKEYRHGQGPFSSIRLAPRLNSTLSKEDRLGENIKYLSELFKLMLDYDISQERYISDDTSTTVKYLSELFHSMLDYDIQQNRNNDDSLYEKRYPYDSLYEDLRNYQQENFEAWHECSEMEGFEELLKTAKNFETTTTTNETAKNFETTTTTNERGRPQICNNKEAPPMEKMEEVVNLFLKEFSFIFSENLPVKRKFISNEFYMNGEFDNPLQMNEALRKLMRDYEENEFELLSCKNRLKDPFADDVLLRVRHVDTNITGTCSLILGNLAGYHEGSTEASDSVDQQKEEKPANESAMEGMEQRKEDLTSEGRKNEGEEKESDEQKSNNLYATEDSKTDERPEADEGQTREVSDEMGEKRVEGEKTSETKKPTKMPRFASQRMRIGFQKALASVREIDMSSLTAESDAFREIVVENPALLAKTKREKEDALTSKDKLEGAKNKLEEDFKILNKQLEDAKTAQEEQKKQLKILNEQLKDAQTAEFFQEKVKESVAVAVEQNKNLKVQISDDGELTIVKPQSSPCAIQ